MSAKNEKLDLYLKQVSENGIQIDRRQLKKDMCSQFANQYEYIREYVVNAFDAQATRCTIFGRETDDMIYIMIRDNGHGMDKEGIIDYFTLYKSVKRGDVKKAIGRHGIGKLSVASIAEQKSFTVLTSTGEEAWRASTGALLSEDPIKLERIEPVPEAGTEFCIGFEKKLSLLLMMQKIYNTLTLYVRYLPMDVQVCIPRDIEKDLPSQWKTIREDWEPFDEPFGQRFHTRINDMTFDIVMSIGNGKHELYQNRVLITDRYNLLSHHLKENWAIPHLHIRVDSPDFELPFGRHCLNNEEILPLLTRRLNTTLLVEFFKQLCEYYHRADTRAGVREIEEMAVLLCHFSNRPEMPWTHLAVFKLVDKNRISLEALRQKVKQHGKLYVASDGKTGVDYSIFDAPVLSMSQPGRGFNVLKLIFEHELLQLDDDLTIIEAPPSSAPKLTQMERMFERSLGFHPETLKRNSNESGQELPAEIKDRLGGTVNAIKSASDDLRKLQWRISYLVQADGKTPARSIRFITRNNTVILNLYHDEIRALVNLCKTNAQLAAHWAVAICITENDQILSHLSAEAKEDLLQLDAMSRLGDSRQPQRSTQVDQRNKNQAYWNFFRNATA
jgi:hypothetical protein